MKKILLNIIFSTLAVVGIAQELPLHEGVIQHKLENGFCYNLLPTYDKGKIHVNITSKMGAFAENSEERGMSHFLEHMLFNGSKNFPNKTAYNTLTQLGLTYDEISAFTSRVNTTYNINIPSGDKKILETALLILNDWTSNLVLDSLTIEIEKLVVYEEIKRAGKEPGITLMKGTSLEGHTVLSSAENVKKITKESLEAFYKKYYTTDMFTLTVAGDFDVNEADKMIKSIFGENKGTKCEVDIYSEIIVGGDNINFEDAKRKGNTRSIDLAAKLPNLTVRTEADLKKKMTWTLLAKIMGLYAGETKSFSDVNILSSVGTGGYPNLSTFSINVRGGSKHPFSTLEDEILSYLASFVNNPISDTVINNCKEHILYSSKKYADKVKSLDEKVSGIGNDFINNFIHMSDTTRIKLYTKVLDQITYNDIKECYMEVLAAPKVLTYYKLKDDNVEDIDGKAYLERVKNPKGDIKFTYQSRRLGAVPTDTKFTPIDDSNLDANTILSVEELEENYKVYKLKNNLTVVTYSFDSPEILLSIRGNGGSNLLEKDDRKKFDALYRNLYDGYGEWSSADVRALSGNVPSLGFRKEVKANSRKATINLPKAKELAILQLAYQFMEKPIFTEYSERNATVRIGKEKVLLTEAEYNKFTNFADEINSSMENSIIFIAGDISENIDEYIGKYLGNITDSKRDIKIANSEQKYPVGREIKHEPWGRPIAIVGHQFTKPIEKPKDIKTELILLGLEKNINYYILKILRDAHGLVYSTGTTYTLSTYPDVFMAMNGRYMIDPNGRYVFSRDLFRAYLRRLSGGEFTNDDFDMVKNVAYKVYNMYYYSPDVMPGMVSDFYLKYGKIYTSEEINSIIKSIRKKDVLNIITELIDMDNFSYRMRWPKDVPLK